jgi:hypothetical protein
MSRRRGIVGALVASAVVIALLVAERMVAGGDADPHSALADPCTHPVVLTSELGTWNDSGFVVAQDMWNNQAGTQTLHACSYRSWSVTATQPDSPGVKTYPDVHRDFDGPRLTSFSEITSRFASHAPAQGVYDFAYDVWLDRVATRGATEVMIWTDHQGTRPHVPRQGTFSSGGVRYTVYRGGRFIAFLGPSRSAGHVDLLAFFRYGVQRGWVRPAATVMQIDYGVEISSTDGRPRHFAVTDFALTVR